MSRPINFTDTSVTKKPYVEIDGIEYEVQDGTYQGGTDLNANTFNKMQDELNMFRNLINIPNGTYTNNGVTYIAKNGVLTYSSGTATADVNIGINITPFTLKAGTYTMSNNSGNYPYIMLFSGDTKVVESEYANNGVKTFTIENETTINNIHLYFGQATPPASVKPQVEENTTATSYVTYVPDNVRNIVNNVETSLSELANKLVFTGMLPANYDLLDLYNSIGLKISIIDNEALKYVNFPSGVYGYGVLITICNSIGASWNNAQIYIADNIGTSDVLGGLYIRTKDSTWIRITGTVGIANTTAS